MLYIVANLKVIVERIDWAKNDCIFYLKKRRDKKRNIWIGSESLVTEEWNEHVANWHIIMGNIWSILYDLNESWTNSARSLFRCIHPLFLSTSPHKINGIDFILNERSMIVRSSHYNKLKCFSMYNGYRINNKEHWTNKGNNCCKWYVIRLSYILHFEWGVVCVGGERDKRHGVKTYLHSSAQTYTRLTGENTDIDADIHSNDCIGCFCSLLAPFFYSSSVTMDFFTLYQHHHHRMFGKVFNLWCSSVNTTPTERGFKHPMRNNRSELEMANLSCQVIVDCSWLVQVVESLMIIHSGNNQNVIYYENHQLHLQCSDTHAVTFGVANRLVLRLGRAIKSLLLMSTTSRSHQKECKRIDFIWMVSSLVSY